jgi:adenylyl- and sulfurtransferase ThiI
MASEVYSNSRAPVVLVSSAEFALKSSPVRRTLEQRLIDDLKFAMRKSNSCHVTAAKSAGRIVLQGVTDSKVAAQICARVFGVAHAIPAMKVDCSLERILHEIVQLAKESLNDDQSFGIRCHRSSPSAISPHEVEVLGGSAVLKGVCRRNIEVNLRKPDLWISVDLSGESAYVYSSKIPGPGGLPLSSQWKMVSILDADILSLFAAYVMMRRGCLVQLLIPNSITDDQSSLDRQLALARKLRRFVTRENYRAFILKHHYQSHEKVFIRLMCLNLARRRRFKGILFADVDGSIHFEERLLARSRELGLPIFQPLVGLGEDDLIELGRIFDVEWAEIKSTLSAKSSTSVESSLVDLSEFTVEEISL